jgi:hypothetical protein
MRHSLKGTLDFSYDVARERRVGIGRVEVGQGRSLPGFEMLQVSSQSPSHQVLVQPIGQSFTHDLASHGTTRPVESMHFGSSRSFILGYRRCMSDIEDALTEALETLTRSTGLDAEALFGDRVIEPHAMSPSAAHAAGVIEGAGIALGLTALELLDELSAWPDDEGGQDRSSSSSSSSVR